MEIMGYEDFVKALCEKVIEVTGHNAEVVEQLKNNSVIRRGIKVYMDYGNMGKILYAEDAYHYYRDHGLEEAFDYFLGGFGEEADAKADLSALSSFRSAKPFLGCKLLNYERNTALLQDVLFERFLDLAAVFTVRVDFSDGRSGMATLSQRIAENWKVSVEEVKEAAMSNLMGTHKARLLSDIICSMSMGGNIAVAENDQPYDLFVAGNEGGFYGAAVMLDLQFLEHFARSRLLDSFIMIPSSVHEVIIASDCSGFVSIDLLKDLVKQVNRSVVGEEDFLSDSVYIYDRKKNRVSIV